MLFIRGYHLVTVLLIIVLCGCVDVYLCFVNICLMLNTAFNPSPPHHPHKPPTPSPPQHPSPRSCNHGNSLGFSLSTVAPPARDVARKCPQMTDREEAGSAEALGPLWETAGADEPKSTPTAPGPPPQQGPTALQRRPSWLEDDDLPPM